MSTVLFYVILIHYWCSKHCSVNIRILMYCKLHYICKNINVEILHPVCKNITLYMYEFYITKSRKPA